MIPLSFHEIFDCIGGGDGDDGGDEALDDDFLPGIQTRDPLQDWLQCLRYCHLSIAACNLTCYLPKEYCPHLVD